MTIISLDSHRPTRDEVLEGVVVDPTSPFAGFGVDLSTGPSTGTDGPLADVIPGAFAPPVQFADADARAVTARLVRALDAAGDALAFAGELYRQAWTGRADIALGYRSWDVYVEQELGNLEALKIPREVRREIVATLHKAGMPKKKIARALGVSDGITRNDLKALEAEADVPALAIAAAPEPVLPTSVRAYAELAAAGTAGLTAPELGKRVRDLLDPGAFLSAAHTNRRVARLAVDEPTGTRLLGDRRFAVYVALTVDGHPLSARVDAADGRAVEGPGRRRRASSPS